MRQKRKSKTRSKGGQNFNTHQRGQTPAGPQPLGEGLAIWGPRELDIHLDSCSKTTYSGLLTEINTKKPQNNLRNTNGEGGRKSEQLQKAQMLKFCGGKTSWQEHPTTGREKVFVPSHRPRANILNGLSSFTSQSCFKQHANRKIVMNNENVIPQGRESTGPGLPGEDTPPRW